MAHQRAFTLAEVLIALALLGIIAAFAVPKILQSSGTTERNAVFKETYAALSEAMNAGMLTGEIYQKTQAQYFGEKLNATKICVNDYVTEGCYPFNIANGQPVPGNAAGIILPNGASIVAFLKTTCTGPTCVNSVLLDTNGTKPPNTTGDSLDNFTTIELVLNYGTTTVMTSTDSGSTAGSGPKPLKPGMILHKNEYVNEERFKLFMQ